MEVLTESLKFHTIQENVPKGETITSEKANLFRKIVADTFLQYDIKEWVYLQKKMLHIFFYFDRQKHADYGHTFISANTPHNSSPGP